MADYFDNLVDEKTEKEAPLTSVELEQKIEPEKKPKKEVVTQAKGGNKALILSLIVIIICIPLTVVISYLAGDKKLYIASVVIMILAMVPFFVNFEHKKPQARELVTLAVMTALAIVARIIFMWLPFFTPMAGVIIITAVGFGPQAGFMCGALSMIVSNIVFGQGPWTPWQMFCYGLIGFIAGLLAKPEIISELHKVRSAIVSFFLVFILSGIVLDTCTIFLAMDMMGDKGALAIYLSGVPVNAASAAASAIVVLFLIKPMMNKINRIKTKYGM